METLLTNLIVQLQEPPPQIVDPSDSTPHRPRQNRP